MENPTGVVYYRKVSGKKILRGPTNSNDDVITSYDIIVTNFPPKYWGGGAAAPR